MDKLSVTLFTILVVTYNYKVAAQHNTNHNDKANALPKDDPGHNTHQEYVIFACLAVSGIFIGLVVLILWFLVDRTKEQLRSIDLIMPQILMNHRKQKNARDEEEMFGTLTANQDLEYKRMTSTELSQNRNSVELTGFRKYTTSSFVTSEQMDADRFEIESDIHAMDITVDATIGEDNSRTSIVQSTPPPYNSPPAYDNPAVQVEENDIHVNGRALHPDMLQLHEKPKRRYKKKYYESNL